MIQDSKAGLAQNIEFWHAPLILVNVMIFFIFHSFPTKDEVPEVVPLHHYDKGGIRPTDVYMGSRRTH